MKKLLLLISLFLFASLHSQQEASNWYFGDGAGIKFNSDGSTTPITGALSTDEGCTSISDNNGNLLFYTDGITVFNANNNPMPNANGILNPSNGLVGSPSSTQSAIIIPKPFDSNIYYIFTVDTGSFDNTDFGFNYSEVDMTLNGGLGDVTVKNSRLLDDSSEKISAVLKDCQTQSIWVVTLANQFGTAGNPIFNTFHAFEVTATGVNTTAVKSTFSNLTIGDQRGYLKFSPDGTKLACANARDGLYIFDFDTATGNVTSASSPPQAISISVSNNAIFTYGLEFSPNNELLYVSSSNDYFNQSNPIQNNNPANHSSSLVQFDLTAPIIQSSQITINQSQSYRSALQLGPDGKIYRSTSATYNIGLPFLSVINNPNEIGAACNFQTNAVQLSANSRQGLPPFITSFFSEKIDIIQDPEITTTFLPLCEGELYTLTAENIPGAIYTWTVDDTIQPTPTIPYEFEVFQNGTYEVLIELNTGDCETFEGEAVVEYTVFPEAFTPPKINVCDDDLNDGFFRFDLSQQDAIILGTQDPADFQVRYYTSELDAINNENELPTFYQNTTNPEEVFARVVNRNNRSCFVTTDENTGLPLRFLIEVYNTPNIRLLNDIELCDIEGDETDGVITLTLSDLNSDVLGPLQNAADYTITYHANQNDANNANNPLQNNYSNTPFNDEIFVRVENNSNTDCFAVQGLTLTINPKPVANNARIFQCDEDGVPDGLTTFNITELETTITGGVADSSITFYNNTADANTEINPINATNFNNTSNPQTVIAKVSNTETNCFSLSEITLETSVTSANNAILKACDTDGVEDGFTTLDLSLADVDVLNGLPSGLSIAYYETLDDALLETNPLPNNYTNTNAFTQIIFVRVENNNDCYGINEIELQISNLPNVETEFETLYCLNTFPETLVLTGGVFDDIPNNYFYNWSTGETTKDIEINTPGVYTVNVSNVFGCSKERTITVLASNVATITAIEVTDAVENNTITIAVIGEGDYEYVLDDPNGIYQDSNSFQNVRPGIYTVYVRDKNGCGITEELVSVIGFPKFFTPNGDNNNDFWEVKGVSSQFQPNTKILIFDRYGKLLRELNPLGSGWDGNYNGNPMPSSDYWFTVTLQDGRQFSSHFALKR